jgi:hypothetical protein
MQNRPLLLLVLLLTAYAWEPCLRTSLSLSRRGILRSVGAAGTLLTTTAAAASLPQPCIAACLAGDLSPDCIGVYKVPVGDLEAVRRMPDAIAQNAPDLMSTPRTTMALPSNWNTAIEVLKTQRLAADDIYTVVQRGQLKEAGIKVLNLVPQVTAAGKVVIDQVSSETSKNAGIQEVQLMQLQSRLDDTLACWGQVDVTLGQGLRGELGVVTVAQLTILSELRDAMRAYDDFLAQVPLQGQ